MLGTHPSAGAFEEFRDTALWVELEKMISELVATREVSINTAPAYVVGYLCRELTAKKMLSPHALEK